MAIIPQDMLRKLVAENKLRTKEDAHNAVKDLMSGIMQSILEAELDEHLGYAKHDVKSKKTSNSRNGHSKKTVTTELGEFELRTPRDREGEFEPELVKKQQTDLSGMEHQIISLYAKGMSTRDIQAH